MQTKLEEDTQNIPLDVNSIAWNAKLTSQKDIIQLNFAIVVFQSMQQIVLLIGLKNNPEKNRAKANRYNQRRREGSQLFNQQRGLRVKLSSTLHWKE